MLNIDFTKEPKEVVNYLKKKKLKLTFNYTEMMHEAHHISFTVAKITRLDLLFDIHESLQSAFKEGKPFKQWKEELTPTLEEKGWLGKVNAINPDTGEVKDIYVGSRRLKTIYDTNMRTAYAQARYKNQMRGDSEFWRYGAVLDSRLRESHRAMHGTILHRTHPFWKKNYPPNGWGCRCKVNAYTKESMEAQGWEESKGSVPDIADKDWAYDVGDTGRVDRIYSDKIKSLAHKGSSLAPTATTAHTKDIQTLQHEAAIYKEIKELFTDKDKKVALCKSTLFGKEKNVLLSSDTVQSHLHHEDVDAFDYSLIPQMLEGEKVVFEQSETKYIVLKKLGRAYRLTLKDITKENEIFIVSLVHVGSNLENEIKRLKKKYKEA